MTHPYTRSFLATFIIYVNQIEKETAIRNVILIKRLANNRFFNTSLFKEMNIQKTHTWIQSCIQSCTFEFCGIHTFNSKNRQSQLAMYDQMYIW